jgi:DNA-binding HxlR family transcriptional regulator
MTSLRMRWEYMNGQGKNLQVRRENKMCEPLEFLQYPVDDSVRMLGRRWVVPVLLEIMQGQNRFNVLLKNVQGVNSRALAARLREFEQNGLVERTITDRRICYSLTEKGKAMRELMREITAFSLKWH